MKKIILFLKSEWKLVVSIIFAIMIGIALFFISGEENDWLSVVSGVLQIVTVAVALYSWYSLYSYKQKLLEDDAKPGDDDLILVVDLTSKELINDVVGFIQANKDDKKLGALSRLHKIESDSTTRVSRTYMELNIYRDPNTNVNGILHLVKKLDKEGKPLEMPFDKNDIAVYIDDFKACMRAARIIMSRNSSTNMLHVFASAPTGLAAFVLCPFTNGKRVTWYAYNRNASDPAEKYYCMGEVKE